MSIHAVTDTHALVWYLYNDKRLSTTAGALLDRIIAEGDAIAISAITLAEIIYLIEKDRVDKGAFDRILTTTSGDNPVLVIVALDATIVRAMSGIERTQIPELPDRIVAATALYLGVPVVSRDHKIQASSVLTIW